MAARLRWLLRLLWGAASRVRRWDWRAQAATAGVLALAGWWLWANVAAAAADFPGWLAATALALANVVGTVAALVLLVYPWLLVLVFGWAVIGPLTELPPGVRRLIRAARWGRPVGVVSLVLPSLFWLIGQSHWSRTLAALPATVLMVLLLWTWWERRGLPRARPFTQTAPALATGRTGPFARRRANPFARRRRVGQDRDPVL